MLSALIKSYYILLKFILGKMEEENKSPLVNIFISVL